MVSESRERSDREIRRGTEIDTGSIEEDSDLRSLTPVQNKSAC